MYTVVTLPGLTMAVVYLMLFSLLLYETIFHIHTKRMRKFLLFTSTS